MTTPTLLYIDDAASMRKVLSLVLDKAFSITLADNGQAGLDALDQQGFDVIISDINMPVMDGLTFLEKARNHPNARFTPILMMTTETNKALKAEGKRLGATGWLVKPFDPKTLPDLLHRLL